jgi:hypothetical protein
MYLAIVLSTMLVFPVVSWVISGVFFGGSLTFFPGFEVWFVFWAFGIRLLGAGLRQVFQPSFTAKHIFELEDPKAQVVVQELGFANIAFGLLGICSLGISSWVLPATVLGCVFYGLAGINHIFRKKNAMEWIALVSDLYAAVLFLCFAILSILPIHV